MTAQLKTLIGKLNPLSRQAAERAASLCRSLGHYEVDLEHMFVALLEQSDSDVATIARRSGIDTDALQQDLQTELSRFKNGNTRTPVFSRHVPRLFEHAWLIASLDERMPHIRSGHLLFALLTEPDLAQIALRSSVRWKALKLDQLKHEFAAVTVGSSEAEAAGAGTCPQAQAASPSNEHSARREIASTTSAATPALDRYTSDLTASARDGAIDPVIGRDREIRQLVDILMRRRQNNPILTGEAGVGKTAVVEGLALRIAHGDVPPPLRDVALRALDMGLLQAGASVKGEFEQRLQSVIDEVKRSARPIVLFIDEAHTMIGAGGQAGQNDAANLLKPALARGELRTIAATTWSEYKKYFEKDAALARRFQVVKVEEPDEALAAAMLRGMTPLMERHFGVRILDEAVTEAARLSHRYISGRQLPDKAVSVLDTACAKVALARGTTPAVIEDHERQLERLNAERAALEREQASGAQHGARLNAIDDERMSTSCVLDAARRQFGQESELVARIQSLRHELEASNGEHATLPSASEHDPRSAQLERLRAELEALQGERPMLPLQVDAHVVAEIVSAWTGIPLGKMIKDDIKTVLSLSATLQERVIGQAHAIEAIAQRVRSARANLDDPNKPQGVFLFVGPSGVGKTETALALADALYGGERKLVTINMSEYQEAHSVSGLKGSPPGYVGYGEGGVLTEAVRRQPYSVVLLDEVEKAHPDVLELFFQVFDKGVLDDAEGREVDFRNTLIILTSNVASSTIMQACLNKPLNERPAPDALVETIRPALFGAFKPAFLGRLCVVPYYPIDDEALERIIRLKLDRIGQRVAKNHGAAFRYDAALVSAVLHRCTEVDSGARNVDHILNASLLPQLAEAVLLRLADDDAIHAIKVGVGKAGAFKFKVS